MNAAANCLAELPRTVSFAREQFASLFRLPGKSSAALQRVSRSERSEILRQYLTRLSSEPHQVILLLPLSQHEQPARQSPAFATSTAPARSATRRLFT